MKYSKRKQGRGKKKLCGKNKSDVYEKRLNNNNNKTKVDEPVAVVIDVEPSTPLLPADKRNDVNSSADKWLRSKRHLLSFGMALFVILATSLSAWLLFKGSGTDELAYPWIPPTSPNDSSINNETGIEFVRRSEWGAADPSESRENLGVLPPPFVIIGHTVTRFCSTRSECKETVWRIQRDHMNSSKPSFYNDIAYNFLVGGDGAVYEGRGWDVRGAHTKPYNDKSLGLAFVGNYNEVRPTLTQLEVTKKLLDYGVRHNKLKDTHVVFGQCQVQRKESPGKKLYEEIKKWEHWSPKSEFECVFNATF